MTMCNTEGTPIHIEGKWVVVPEHQWTEIEKLRAALVRIDGEASQGAPNSLIEEIAQKALNGGDDE